MSKEQPRTGLRSFGAVIAGLITVLVLHTGTDVVLHATGVFPPWGKPMSNSLFALALTYRTIFSILGTYITAVLAPQRPMKHALILGAIGVVLSTVGLVATWNAGPEFGPRWYPIALVVTTLPTAWLGGKLRLLQTSKAN